MDRRFKILVAALVALSPLAACMPETPETALSWNVNDKLPRHSAAHPDAAGAQYVAGDTARTYVYQGDAYAVPAPKPRPTFTTANLPPIVSNYGSASSSVAFTWPVSGKILSPFGAGAGGARNDGINIAAPRGTPIHAAAGGTVTYAGNELKDYGNLVLIKHADGYVTAYAHADRLIVGKGDAVTKGQVIGYAGNTGDVSVPQLHFEIRHDTTPVNPSNLLMARNS